MERNQGIDLIRILLTFLVIVHHVAIVYGGAGGWYWKEIDEAKPYLILFNTINQSFFMGFFFLLAGYFSKGSIESKGVKIFLNDRLVRLGIPLVIYFGLISPFTIALANPAENVSLLQQTFNMMWLKEFEPGPLWFVFSLILFSTIYCFVSAFIKILLAPLNKIPRVGMVFLILVAMGIITFLVRLAAPTGQSVFWLQLGYFPMYIFLFIVGALSYRCRLLSTLKFSDSVVWLAVSAVLILILPIVMFHPLGDGAFEGGFNINALFYALWEPFVACGVILGLLYGFSSPSKHLLAATTALAPLAYCIYIIHPPVVVFLSMQLANWDQAAIVKLICNSVLSITGCILLSWLIVKLPFARRIL